MADPSRTSATRSAGVVGVAVMCSRVLGLIRELVFAALFGAGRSLDAFLVAFRTPNMLRDLFAEGALSTAFVTTFSQKIATEGDGEAWRLANKVATLAAIVMSLIVIGGIILAPWVIEYVVAPGFSPEKTKLTVMLARIMYPFILMVSLAALVMGMLNAKHVFGVPAMASSFFNIGSIVGGVTIGYVLDPGFGPKALAGVAIGTLIGGFLQLAIQLPSLHKEGFRFRPDFGWRDPGVRKVLSLMGPAVIAASAVQVNVVVNTIFASWLQDGAVSWLAIAFRLMQLPLGVFGVAIGTVTLPLVSRSAAQGNIAEFRSTLTRGMRLALLLTIPSALGLWTLAEPIISVIYRRGRFDVFDTRMTAAALQSYALGLVAYSVLKVLTPAFYAIGRKKTPMMVSFVAIAMNLVLNGFFVFYLAPRVKWLDPHQGLAFSTSLVATINFAVLYLVMRRVTARLETRLLFHTLSKLALPALALVLVCWIGLHFFLKDWARLSFPVCLAGLSATISLGAVVYFAGAYLLGIEEMRDVASIFRRRFASGAGRTSKSRDLGA